jgi:hypothetical protein
MRERATALAVALGLVVVGMACSGGAEKNVVNQYFNALAANDTNTLTSFAAVSFDKKVESHKIVSVSEETRIPAPLPGFVAQQQELEAALAQNMKDARAWGNDLEVYPKLDKVRELQKDDKKIPSSLQPIAEKWDAFNAKDRELKTQAADAKRAVEVERRNTRLSIGQREGADTLTGEVVTKNVDLELTIDGQAQPYVMGLRKYELEGDGTGARMMSRWVVQSLDPK